MRKDTTFSDRKLTEKEFSDKYWMGGQFPYQYHTASIEDGRDELEQFLINNCRALWERMNRESEWRRDGHGDAQTEIEQLREMVARQHRELESLRMLVMIQLLAEHAKSLSKPAQNGGEIGKEVHDSGEAARKLVIEVSDGGPCEGDIVRCIVSRADVKKVFGL